VSDLNKDQRVEGMGFPPQKGCLTCSFKLGTKREQHVLRLRGMGGLMKVRLILILYS
jgi:hypothetical protein